MLIVIDLHNNDQTFITPTQRNQTRLTQFDSCFRLLFQVEEEKNVYDIVNEDEYSEIVRQRQDDDWIVDDGEIDLNTHTHPSVILQIFKSMRFS